MKQWNLAATGRVSFLPIVLLAVHLTGDPFRYSSDPTTSYLLPTVFHA